MSNARYAGLAAVIIAWAASDLPVMAQARSSASGIQFNLQQQPLTTAIESFTRITGLDVIGDGALPRDVQSGAAVGVMRPEEALRQLLSGTNIRFEFTNATTIVLLTGAARDARAQTEELPTIEVRSSRINPNTTMTLPPVYAGGQVATGAQLGLLGNRSVMDTPFNQISYTAQLIQDQQARKLDDVLANDPSVRPNAPRAYGFDFVSIRGFDVPSTAYGINGLYGIASNFSFMSMAAVERVDVLKGPGTLLNGMPPGGGVGGSINIVTKRAGNDPIAQMTNTFESKSNFGTQVDLGRRFGENNEFGLRFNGSYRAGDTALDNQSQELSTAALAFDYRGERVRFSVDLGYEKNNTDAMTRYVSFGTLNAVPVPPDARAAFMPSWGYWNGEGRLGLIQGEYDLSENLTAYVQAGIVAGTAKYLYSDAMVNNLNGNFSGTARLNSQNRDQSAIQTGFRASFDTGFINHVIDFNVAGSSSETKITNSARVASLNFNSNLYNPAAISAPNVSVGAPFKTGSVNMSSYGIADTMSMWDKRIQITVGVRKQYVETAGFNILGQTSSYDTEAWTPGYAIVIKPWDNVSLYANYVEGLEAGSVVGSTYLNVGQVLPPFQTKQIETGVKIDWGKLITTVSAFDITRPLQIAQSVPGGNILTQDGERRHRGIEVNTFGELAEGVRILGGVMFLDARQEKTERGLYEGNRVFGVSDIQLNLGGEWDTPFIRGLTLTGRAIHNSDFFANAANTQLVSDWTRYDLGARYTFVSPWNKKPIVIRFAVENVLNTNYWQGANSDRYVFLGAPRTYLASTTFNF